MSTKMGPLGMVIEESVSFDEWQKIGESLAFGDGMHQWWIGDWLIYGEKKFGEKCQEIQKTTKFAKGYLVGMKSVAAAIPISMRRATLKWGHHKEIAVLASEEMKKSALDWAENQKVIYGKISVKCLREAVLKMRGGNSRPRKEKLAYGDTLEQQAHHNAIADAIYKTITDKSYEVGNVVWAAFRGMVPKDSPSCSNRMTVDDRYRITLYLSKQEAENLPNRRSLKGEKE